MGLQKALFFGVHNPNEFKNQKVYKNYDQKQFVEFLIPNSCLNEAKHLVRTNDGRAIYKLTSDSSLINQ